MRDFQRPGRSAAYGFDGMAATSHPLATLAAADVLRDGGNAADAAVTAVAVQCVVEPHMTGIGGDCFALVAPASGGVVALNGSGRAPAGASAERLREEGLDAIPEDGVHAVTVPGAVAGWGDLLERFGRRGLDAALRPAIRFAREGFPIAPRVAFDWARNAGTLKHSEAAERFYLPNGEAPRAGDRVRLPALAATLEAIAAGGARAFYEGALAARMAATLRGFGGAHDEADFAAQTAEFVPTIRTGYRGVEVHECPPNGQGVAALLMLNILEGFDTAGVDPGGAERLHREVEATRLAYRDRNALVADPRFAEVPLERLLDTSYAAELRALIDPDRAMPSPPPPLLKPHKDTVYVSVVDREGNAVSLINSLFEAFGSGLACPDTGVLFHNRGLSFVLDPGHPNVLAPGKRPLHTIIPGMALKDGKLWACFGVMGGHYQAIGHVHALTNMIDFGMDPQEALDTPRVSAADGVKVEVERGVPDAVAEGLRARGHPVVRAEKPIGGGQIIRVDHGRGVLIGGSDPRKDGLALGF